ncbi:hypothetical protein V8D89_002578 [Ganoderma adspersum]
MAISTLYNPNTSIAPLTTPGMNPLNSTSYNLNAPSPAPVSYVYTAETADGVEYDPTATYLNRSSTAEDIDMMSQKSDSMTSEILKAIQQDIQAHHKQDSKDMNDLKEAMGSIKDAMMFMKDEFIVLSRAMCDFINVNRGGTAGGNTFQG